MNPRHAPLTAHNSVYLSRPAHSKPGGHQCQREPGGQGSPAVGAGPVTECPAVPGTVERKLTKQPQTYKTTSYPQHANCGAQTYKTTSYPQHAALTHKNNTNVTEADCRIFSVGQSKLKTSAVGTAKIPWGHVGLGAKELACAGPGNSLASRLACGPWSRGAGLCGTWKQPGTQASMLALELRSWPVCRPWQQPGTQASVGLGAEELACV
ncbi:hypothetical protein Bbelb_203290 [Branchiostoma belcheri]|nr:hypothetical protein Bbelb_203290 [Branchiostoma belcheri]